MDGVRVLTSREAWSREIAPEINGSLRRAIGSRLLLHNLWFEVTPSRCSAVVPWKTRKAESAARSSEAVDGVPSIPRSKRARTIQVELSSSSG